LSLAGFARTRLVCFGFFLVFLWREGPFDSRDFSCLPSLTPTQGSLNHKANDHALIEFKEIRKEWKAKKKEEEAARKADEERQRQEQARNAQEHGQEQPGAYGQMRTPIGPPPQMGGPQLPPIGYAPAASGQAPAQYGTQSPSIEGMAQYATTNQVYNGNQPNGSSFPQSPYGQNNQMYQQRHYPS